MCIVRICTCIWITEGCSTSEEKYRASIADVHVSVRGVATFLDLGEDLEVLPDFSDEWKEGLRREGEGEEG